jgi:hypothetical protein
VLCPLNPVVWLLTGLEKDEEILLQVTYPDLQKVQIDYIEELLCKNIRKLGNTIKRLAFFLANKECQKYEWNKMTYSEIYTI